MARVLVTPDVFDLYRIGSEVKGERIGVRVDPDSGIELRTPGAKVTLRLSENDKGPPLVPGDLVYVWWHAGGFVCVRADEVEALERRSLDIKEEVRRAREKLAQARRDRPPAHAPSPPRDAQLSMWDAFG
jgi:hypothetical protein